MKSLGKILGIAVLCGVACSVPAKADTVYFRDSDRTMHDYVTVPSDNGTVTFYERGSVLPDTVTYTQLPTTVTTRLAPAPEGDVYVTAGGNAYLIDHDRRIVDAYKLRD